MNTIQSKTQIALTSTATWVLAAQVVFNAINGNISIVPIGWMPFVNLALIILAGYLHANHVQAAAQLGSTRV